MDTKGQTRNENIWTVMRPNENSPSKQLTALGPLVVAPGADLPWGWKGFKSPFKSRVRHFSCRTLQSYNSPGDWARELFKPSTDSASLVVKIEKNNFLFRWGFSEGDVTKRTCFGKVGHPWPALGPNPLTHSIGSKFCWKLDENPRL